MRVHDSQAYRKMDVTRERISRILELKEILLSIQTGFSLVNAAVACAILEPMPEAKDGGRMNIQTHCQLPYFELSAASLLILLSRSVAVTRRPLLHGFQNWGTASIHASTGFYCQCMLNSIQAKTLNASTAICFALATKCT